MRPIIALAILSLVLPAAAVAADISVPVDQSRRIPMGGSAASVVVGNTAIADVRAIDSRTLMVVGKRQGVTNVVVFDANGRTLFEGEITVSAGSGPLMTVYRGANATEYSCSPYCQATSGVSPAAPVAAAPSEPTIRTVEAPAPAPVAPSR